MITPLWISWIFSFTGMIMSGVSSSMPFIASVLDTLEPGAVSVDEGCAILATAIAPEIGIGTPPGVLRRVKQLFRHLLVSAQSRTAARPVVEARLREIFAIVAARDFEALTVL